jgi:hypothetical protein
LDEFKTAKITYNLSKYIPAAYVQRKIESLSNVVPRKMVDTGQISTGSDPTSQDKLLAFFGSNA